MNTLNQTWARISVDSLAKSDKLGNLIDDYTKVIA